MTTTRGEPPDFDDWYRREFPRVSRAMALACGDPGLGEEAFALALVHWGRVRRMESPGGWVYATALNQSAGRGGGPPSRTGTADASSDVPDLRTVPGDGA